MNRKYAKEIFPAGLLIEGRRCLVVGGGTVAARKVSHLLDANADTKVVSPEANDIIKALAEEGRIQWDQRAFEDSDADGQFIVFAATDDKSENKRIIARGRDCGSLCCSVDGNWVDGDFVTPAILRKDGLTISVSTGGRSCRRSRLVKDNLARHVEMVESADLIVIGTSHKELSVKDREPYHLVGERMLDIGQMCQQIWGIHEFTIINTCNRVELHAVVSREAPIEKILKRVLAFFHLTDEQFYIKRGFEAFDHMSTMLAGLYSQTPGENHIVSQTKGAFDVAAKQGWAMGMMRQWLDSALHVSKRIRQATRSMLKATEIEDLSIQYLSAEGELRGKRLMVIGTGVVGRGLIDNLTAAGAECTWCYHVNRPEDYAGVHICSLNDLRDELQKAEAVICATASPGHILHRGHAPFFDQERSTIVIDLSVPRNVEPELNDLADNLKVVDLDDLKHWYRREAADMSVIMGTAREVVEDHKDRYEQIINSFQGGNKE